MIIFELIKNRILATQAVFRLDFLLLPIKAKIKLFFLAVREKPVSAGGNFFVSTFAAPINSPAYSRFLKWFDNFLKGKQSPRYLSICLTNKCLYNCEHCSNKNACRGEEITFEEIKKVIDFFIDKGIFRLTFTGGEPLLNPDLTKIIAGLDKKKVCTVICTSGYGLSKEKAVELKKAGLTIVKIGLDSSDKEKNDNHKKYQGAFLNSLEAIKNAKEAGLCVFVQTLLEKEFLKNQEKFFKFIDFLEKLGVHEVQFLEPKPCGKYLFTDKLIGRKEKYEFYKLARKVNWSLRRIKCSSYFELEDKIGCEAGFSSFYLDAVGNFMPCAFTQVSFGNIRKESLEKIYERFRSVFAKPNGSCLSFKLASRKKAGLETDCYSLGKN